MTVKQFIETLPKGKEQAHLRSKAKQAKVLNEDVLSDGNDMWLACELNINRLEVEKVANPKFGK